MEQEYTITTTLKYVYGSLAVLLAGFALFLFSIYNPKNGPWVMLVPIALLLLAVYIIANQVRSALIVSDYSITRISALSKKELPLTEIKGCRIGQKTFSIESVSSSGPIIRVNNFTDLRGSEELIKWLKEKFVDLDALDLKEEQKKILEDSTLGATPEEREYKVKMAKRVAISYNVLGGIFGFSLVLGNIGPVASLFAILFPLLGIVIMLFSRGLIKFVSNNKRSVYSFIMLGFIIPAFTMLIHSFGDYEIYQYQHIGIPFLAISVSVSVLLYLTGVNRAIGIIAGQVIIMLFAGLVYGYGCTVQINCTFDKSQPELIQTKVNSKWIEHSKGSHYHLRLNTWDLDQTPKDIEVSIDTYNKYTGGDNINVYLKKGLLNIPWYSLYIQ